jgi:hypothetical protein
MDRYLDAGESHDLLVRLFPRGLEDAALLDQIRRGPWSARNDGELADLAGQCLWDLVSNNHQLIDRDGNQLHLGSFRFVAGIIADFRSSPPSDQPHPEQPYDYIDFYLGTFAVRNTDDLIPIYELIFRRIRRIGLDWQYAHPRFYLIDFGEKSSDTDAEDIDPSAAVARDLERRQKQESLAEMRNLLDEEYRRSAELAREGPPPATVRAYRKVYGRFPSGWPPDPAG